MQFVILTDTHFVHAGCRLYGLDPAYRLSRALELIRQDHPDIAFIIITGDLAHRGETAAYEHLRAVLAEASAPAYLVLGNHDRRRPFWHVFPDAGNADHGFRQDVKIFADFTMILLDTLNEDEPTHSGLLCSERLAFLETSLDEAPLDRPILLFQHHPPFDIGIPSMDAIKLSNADDELAVMMRTRKPDYLFIGHVHRPVSGHWHGIPFHIQRAINHQVALDMTTAEFIPGTHEAPDYSLVSVNRDDIIIHQCSFLYNGPVFNLFDQAAAEAPSPECLPTTLQS